MLLYPTTDKSFILVSLPKLSTVEVTATWYVLLGRYSLIKEQKMKKVKFVVSILAFLSFLAVGIVSANIALHRHRTTACDCVTPDGTPGITTWTGECIRRPSCSGPNPN